MKQKINRSNFEAFYLDFLESKLSSIDEVEFIAFLEENPELKIPSNAIDFKLDRNGIEKYPTNSKKELYQFSLIESKVDSNSISFFQAANVDGLLSAEKQKELEEAEHRSIEFQKSAVLFNYTKLKPDFTLVFENKQQLKRPEGKGISLKFIRYAAAAACISGLIVYQIHQDEKTTTSIAKQIAKPESKNGLSQKNTINTSLPSSSVPTFSKPTPQFDAKDSLSNIPILEKTEISPSYVEFPAKLGDSSIKKPQIIELIQLPKEQFTSINPNEIEQTLPIVRPSDVLEHKQFPLLTKLVDKFFHINLGLGKKTRIKSDEYYLVIGSFQVTRNISK